MPISTIGSNSLNQTSDLTINGQTVGKGGGNVATNTAHGVSALAANTSGANNVSIGYQASYSNTTASEVVAIGKGALYTNSTGDTNTAVGFNALTLATGAENTALGNRAMQAHTTGVNNVAVGRLALQANTTTSRNTAVGYQASYASTTAENTCIGYIAGYTNVSGANNTYVGSQAGANATGSNNTFVGQATGSAISTGAKNTIIGCYNGNQGGLDIRTSSNQIVLSDGDGNPRLWGDSGGSWMVGASRSFARALVDIPTSGGNAGAPLAISRGGDGGSMVIFYSMSSTTTVIGSIGNSSNTNTTYNTSSDYRLKDEVTPMSGALDKVSALKPVTWKWKSTGEDGQGFIAHELAQVIPDCVTGEKDAVDADGNPVYQGVDTSYLVATLTKAIQELKTIVDAQAAEIAELKAKVA